MQFFHYLDYAVLQAAVRLAYSSGIVQGLVFVAVQLLIFVFFPVVCVLALQESKRNKSREIAVQAIVAVITGLAIKGVLSYVYVRHQPYLSHPDLPVMNVKINGPGFPSLYVLISGAVAGCVLFGGYRTLGNFLLATAIFIALAHVMAGVAYPSDVLAGGVLAYVISWTVHRERLILKKLA
jgi:undecaprenyl-diphosphatase